MVHKVTLFPLSGIESFDDVVITASDGDIKLEPTAGSEILLDDTIHIDAGVVTGATSITSTSFVGALTGNASGLSASLAVGSGGTGATTLTTDGVLFGNGTSAISAVDLSTSGNIIVGGSTPAVVTGANLAGSGLGATVGDGTLVLAVDDPLNQDTTGTAATVTGATQANITTLAGVSAIGTAGTPIVVTSDTVTFTSASADDPLVTIKNTSSGANDMARLNFVKDRGGAGSAAALDNCAEIRFMSEDHLGAEAQYGLILSEIDVATAGQESGALKFGVANYDGTNDYGLIMTGGDSASANEVDVTIGYGTTSAVTMPGILTAKEVGSSYATGAAPGSGVADALNKCDIYVEKIGQDIITTIYVDLEVADGYSTAVSSSATTWDVIGEGTAANAYITKLTTAVNGYIYKAEMTCVEIAAGGNDWVALGYNSSSLAGGALITAGSNGQGIISVNNMWVGLTGSAAFPYGSQGNDLTNDYIYLISGDNAIAGSYTAGKFVIKFYGHTTAW